MGDGYGPYIYGGQGQLHPECSIRCREAYQSAPPPLIKIKHGNIHVAMSGDIPGIRCVTVTIVAFNNAELATMSLSRPPFVFNFPVMDGCKNVRVSIDYVNNGLSATSYPL